LAEAARVLVPDGILFVLEPIASGAYFELTKLVEDETFVRAKAYEALAGAPAHGLIAMVEETYRNPLAFQDFETFEARMIAVDPTRSAVVESHRASLRQRFEASAQTTAEGYRFYQPARINLFRKS
jgi:hypothetical protein